MKYLKLSKTFPDGRILNYHKVHDIVVDSENVSNIRIGSWTFFSDMNSGGVPEHISNNITNNGNGVLEAETLLEVLQTQPEWQGAEFYDTSIPVEGPLPLLSLPVTNISNQPIVGIPSTANIPVTNL